MGCSWGLVPYSVFRIPYSGFPRVSFTPFSCSPCPTLGLSSVFHIPYSIFWILGSANWGLVPYSVFRIPYSGFSASFSLGVGSVFHIPYSIFWILGLLLLGGGFCIPYSVFWIPDIRTCPWGLVPYSVFRIPYSGFRTAAKPPKLRAGRAPGGGAW